MDAVTIYLDDKRRALGMWWQKLQHAIGGAPLLVAGIRAMRDPAYRTPDTVAEKDGMDWLERWAAVKHKDLPEEGDDDPPADIQAAYDRVDNDRH